MDPSHKATPQQRKRALITAVVLAAMVLGIYGVFMFKFFARAGA